MFRAESTAGSVVHRTMGYCLIPHTMGDGRGKEVIFQLRVFYKKATASAIEVKSNYWGGGGTTATAKSDVF